MIEVINDIVMSIVPVTILALAFFVWYFWQGMKSESLKSFHRGLRTKFDLNDPVYPLKTDMLVIAYSESGKAYIAQFKSYYNKWIDEQGKFIEENIVRYKQL